MIRRGMAFARQWHSNPAYRWAVLALAAVLIGAGAVMVFERGDQRATAYFPEVKGLYVGDDVQLLGVRIGEVTEIAPEPDRVRVELKWAADQPVPADAKAVLVAPSLVSVRHIALTPVYTGGPRLEDGSVIPISRTVIPVEWDQMKEEVDKLVRALGPKGANSDGSLSRLLDTSAANLKGSGTSMNRTLRSLSEAMSTLADADGDIFGTVRNLQVFVEALAAADAQVFEFNGRLRRVSEFLAEDRKRFGAAFTSLDKAFTVVTRFLKDNRQALRDTTDDLRPIADMLADERQGLADALQWAPHVISNLNNFYDPVSGSLTGQLSLANLQAPGVLICSAIYNLGGPPEMCQQALAPLAELMTLPPPPAGANLLQRNGYENQVVSVPGPDNPRYTGKNGPGTAPDGYSNPPVAGLSGLLSPGGNG